MRKRIKKYLPDHEAIRSNRWLAPFADTLLHPRLWHLNRHSAAGAVAAGLFCGLIPGPLQMLGAAICSVIFRVNLPLALLTTLYTNPFTIVPLYFVAYGIGHLVLGARGEFVPPPAFDLAHYTDWVSEMGNWVLGQAWPLGIGLVLLASALSIIGYFSVRAIWRWHLVGTWRRRRQTRKQP